MSSWRRPCKLATLNYAQLSEKTATATKQRFIDATKTLLDIANESPDAFPPLKSCLGGINALIKYYEVRLNPIADDPSDASIPGMQRRQRQPHGPCHIV